MQKRVPLICLVGAFLLTGCEVRSLRPLVTDVDAIFDPALLGTWVEKGDEQGVMMKFRKSGEKGYQMTLETAKGATHFDARLIQLRSSKILDLSPQLGQSHDEDDSSLYYNHLIPTHSFARINVKNSTLSISSLSHDNLKSLIAQGQLDIGHVVLDNDVILLTAGTPELQRFLSQHADEVNFFAAADELDRIE